MIITQLVKKQIILIQKELNILSGRLQISKKFYIKKKIIFILYFILENFLEFIKVLKNLMNVSNSNSIGTKEVFKFCLDNKVKLIYSATSATLGRKGNDKNLSHMLLLKQIISSY